MNGRRMSRGSDTVFVSAEKIKDMFRTIKLEQAKSQAASSALRETPAALAVANAPPPLPPKDYTPTVVRSSTPRRRLSRYSSGTSKRIHNVAQRWRMSQADALELLAHFESQQSARPRST